jgi:hypothetical protein
MARFFQGCPGHRDLTIAFQTGGDVLRVAFRLKEQL